MRTHNTVFRLTTAAAIGGLTLGPAMQQAAWAQTPPPPADAAPAGPNAGDPPARVGRLASLAGTVSFHTAGQDHWDAAIQNYPVTSGDAFWTEPQAAAAIEIGSTHIALSEQSEFDVDTLDNTALAATEPQGEVYLRVPMVANGETYTITTPRGSVAINAVGRIEIAAGDTDTPTTVTVVDGSATVTGPNLSLSVGAHQTATITGTENFQGSVGAETDDAFLTAQLQLEQQLPPLANAQPASSANATATATVQAPATAAVQAPATAAYTPPPVVQEMTGASDLETQGSWADTSNYGHVWYPPVQRDWVPYRDGHWGYVAPWGWTWIDNSSWGFAPFHYGRWVDVDDRWGWTPIAAGETEAVAEPGYYAGPVYSPALVSFVGIGAAAAVGFAAGLALSGGFGGNVGWVPLGYREPYFPPYYVSRPYLAGINRFYVPRPTLTNITNNYTRIYNNNSVHNTVINNYYGNKAGAAAFANRRGATFAPASAMVRSEPIAPHVVRVSAQQLAQARPLAAPPVRPTAQTIGVSRPVLQRVNPVAAQAAAKQPPARPAAPGPAVRPMPQAAPGRPATAVARPALVPHGAAKAAPAGAAPAAAARPPQAAPAEAPKPANGPRPPAGAAAPKPNGLPALKAPGTPEPNTAARPGAPGPAIAPRAGGPAPAPAVPHPGAAPPAAQPRPAPEVRPPAAPAPPRPAVAPASSASAVTPPCADAAGRRGADSPRSPAASTASGAAASAGG